MAIDVLELLTSARPTGVVVTLDIEEGVTVRADAGQLKQVLWNLFLNALQAMPEGGDLRVGVAFDAWPQELSGARRNNGLVARREAGSAGRAARLSVADTGQGFPPNVQDRIFEPFFTTKTAGSGLGLSTVYRIIENHGGELQVESREENGTTFRVWIPAAEAQR
jgi:signal transduction histidine kinase